MRAPLSRNITYTFRSALRTSAEASRLSAETMYHLVQSQDPEIVLGLGDFNADNKLDLFFANYGPSWLMRNDGGGKFTDVAPQMGVAVNRHLVSAGWGDYDNDGKPDLYTDGYLVGHLNIRDYLFHNLGDHFADVTSGDMLKNDADHAVNRVDYDNNGAIDLALANHDTGGLLSLYHNKLPTAQAHHSLKVLVVDSNGHSTKAGAEVRLYGESLWERAWWIPAAAITARVRCLCTSVWARTASWMWR